MSHHRTLVALLAAAAVGAACRSGPKPDPIPASVPGTYAWTARGAVLNKFSWHIEAKLDLRPDGTYTLTLDKVMNGERDSTERMSGTYTVSGDKVWVKESQDLEGYRSRGSHSLVIRPDSLLGEVGWSTHLILRGIGAPDPVFVKRQRI